MIRRIIQIDQERCNGCGLCVEACCEGAIGLMDGKAALLRDDYCDGLGDCIPTCPMNAISCVEREALEFDAAAVAVHMGQAVPFLSPGGSPQTLEQRTAPRLNSLVEDRPSQLRNWPIQIKMAPLEATYFNGSHLLIAADCVAYAYAGFHEKFMRGRVVLTGCPKLDQIEYVHKLSEIIAAHDIRSVTLVRMEVSCCGGLEDAMRRGVKNSGKLLPYQVVTISTEGEIL